MKRILILVFTLGLFFTSACAIAQNQGEETPQTDRYLQVFDRSGDEGKLVARFLKLSLAKDSSSDEKSGDSTILTSPDGKVMLLDGGSPQCATQVEGYLEALGIHRIDAIVASHPHIDHIGGLTQILTRYPVDTLYMSKIEYPTSTYNGFMEAAVRSGTRIVLLEEGSEFAFGDLVKVKIYNPEPSIRYYAGYPANSTQFINNKSLVMKFLFGESTMLFMGDVYSSREVELIEKFGSALQSDVIKVGHHGSDTSSSKSFVKLVAPKVAAIMHDNLASLQVYKNYRKTDAMAYVSCIDGSIKVVGDSAKNWTVLTQFDRVSDFLK
jgi:competence protein ComEC